MNKSPQKASRIYKIIKAVTIDLSVFYPLFIFLLPLAPQAPSNGFLEFPPLATSFILLIATLPIFAALTILFLCVMRITALMFCEPHGTKIHKTLRSIYVLSSALAIISILSFIAYLSVQHATFTALIVCIVSLILSMGMAIAVWITEKRAKSLISKPNIVWKARKSRVFIGSVILLAVILLTFPCSTNRASYEYDVNEYVYQRTNSLVYSYIKVEKRETKETVERKLVIFPINYMDTSEIFKLK